ncbi:glycosyltransferase family 4 protein [Aurantibacter sp.]|uniref:glycosyltransferase family 4 protein n=1 Tax=Aurantibacter sp. TaxID=2807103 RepID=UPI0035C7FCF1
MSKLEKVLIIGPVSDFGGREIEVKNIATALIKNYQITLFSIVPITNNSSALIDYVNFKWNSIEKSLFKNNFLIKFSSLISKHLNSRKEPSYSFVKNKLTKKYISFNRLTLKLIKREIKKYDKVIFTGELSSKWLKEIIEICNLNNKPLIIRTTGTILSVPIKIEPLLSKVSSVLVHSKSNLTALNSFKYNNLIIDQTTLYETELLKLKTRSSETKLVFGYLGRLAKEKGVLGLLNVFVKTDLELIVAGKGPYKEDVELLNNKNSNINYIGELSGSEIVSFFDKIDVLVIPSLEEAGPLVGIEAMAAGKIVVSTKVGAMMERLYNTTNNFWFDINNEKSLLEVLQKLNKLSKEEIIAIQDNIRAEYTLKYSNNIISQLYLELIRNS